MSEEPGVWGRTQIQKLAWKVGPVIQARQKYSPGRALRERSRHGVGSLGRTIHFLRAALLARDHVGKHVKG